MKNQIIILIFFASLLSSLQGQNVYIPDQNFKEQLIWLGIDSNNDNEISFDEAAIVNYLDISSDWIIPIEDITGIEAFISLDTLICVGNIITSIDSLARLPLKYLDCTWNSILSINFTMPDLEYLKCTENNISIINASFFQKLKTLKCSPSDSLIIDNPFLEELYVESNIAINTNFAPELRTLICHANSPPNLGNNNKLTYLEIFSQLGQIENLNLTENINLKHLYIWCNLTSIDLTNNTDITYLNLMQNDLFELDLTYNTQIDTLICRINDISSLDLSNNPNLLFVDCSGNNITNLNLSNLTKLKTLWCSGNDLTEINLSENNALVDLNISYNQLSNIDPSMNANLEYLICGANNMSESIDLSQNTNLRKINCSENNLQTLDLSKNLQLGVLWCQDNNLSELNVNNLDVLGYLHCFNNNLKTLDLHTNVSVTWMQCGNNLFDSLDLSHNDSWSIVGLNGMPSLTKVCVSELPVQYTIGTTGSPNITFEVCSFLDVQNTAQNTPKIYPNPTTGIITIENVTYNKSSVALYNINGNLIFDNSLNEDKQNIDISNVPKGIYILRIITDKNVHVQRILKK